MFGAAGLAIAAWLCRPKLAVSHKLNGRDVAIEIAIGDIFGLPGALIIGSNTTFDTRISVELISEKSVQGVFTRQFYGDEGQLDKALAPELDRVSSSETLKGARAGKKTRYPIGTCARVDPKGRTAYLVAIGHMNESGVASSDRKSVV